MSDNIKVKITGYKDCIIIEPTSFEKDEDFTPVGGGNLGNILGNTQNRLGMSVEAVSLLKKVKRGRDAIGDIMFFTANDDKDCFGWLGNIYGLFPFDKIELARDSVTIPRHIVIENIVPSGAKNVIDKSNENKE